MIIKDPALGNYFIEEDYTAVHIHDATTGKHVRKCANLNEAFQDISQRRFHDECTEELTIHQYAKEREKIMMEIMAAQQGDDLMTYLLKQQAVAEEKRLAATAGSRVEPVLNAAMAETTNS